MITLYDLMNNTTIQGDIKLTLFSSREEYISAEWFSQVDDLSTCDIPDGWDDYEVMYMFVKDNCLNIEIYKSEDDE